MEFVSDEENRGTAVATLSPEQYPNGYTHIAKVLILFGDPEDSVSFLALEDRHGRFKRKFNLPGGHLEEGEQPWQAAQREVFEELGLEIPPEKLRYVRAITLDELQIIGHLFIYHMDYWTPTGAWNAEPDEHNLWYFRPTVALSRRYRRRLIPGLSEALRHVFEKDTNRLVPEIGRLILQHTIDGPDEIAE